MAGKGLEGDRFFDWKPDYKGQVTFFALETHEWLSQQLNVMGKAPSVFRRNLNEEEYAAVSKADGTFEIKNVPAGGELELQIWHEKAGYVGELTVAGKAEKIAKGRKKVKVAAGDNDLGEMVLDANLFAK